MAYGINQSFQKPYNFDLNNEQIDYKDFISETSQSHSDDDCDPVAYNTGNSHLGMSQYDYKTID